MILGPLSIFRKNWVLVGKQMSIPLIPSAKKSVWLSHLWRAVCYSLYWTKMTITNFLYSFAWLRWVIKLLTTSLLSETLFFLHLSVVSFISLATFPHRSLLGCFLFFSLCSVLYSILGLFCSHVQLPLPCVF